MRYAIGRLLWIVPLLILVSLTVFWTLARASADAESKREQLPLFFNAQPRDIRRLSLAAMRSVARNDATTADARATLVRLGGAGLPHVLPMLDTLTPEEQARVALTLAPVARRMGVGNDDELADPEAAVLFWRRFWEDRAIDFRPVAARRTVERAAERDSAARRADIAQLDTYALPELVHAMPLVRNEQDVARAARVTALLAAVTGNDWRVEEDDTPQQAQQQVTRWQQWWGRQGAQYVTHDGPQRVYAMFVQTRYGQWATEAATSGLGVTRSGDTVASVARAHAPWTLWLVGWGLAGGYFIGLVVGLVAGTRPRGPADTLTAIVTTLLVAAPVAWVASWWQDGPTWWGPVVMVTVVGAVTSRYHRSAVRDAIYSEPASLLRAHGFGRWQLGTATLRSSGYVLGSLLGVDLPLLLTFAFIVERGLGLPGLSEPTVAAIVDHDTAWLMALAIASAATVGFAQIVGDAVLALVDPRARAVLSPRREAWE